jgi:hypothetical protein
VLSGYRNRGVTVLIADPNIADPGTREIPASDFEIIWNSSGVGSNKRAALFTQP